MPILAENRKARFDYDILETLEAGISLLGYEVKAARAGRVQLTGAFVTFHRSQAMLTNAGFAPYQAKNAPQDFDERRPRRLLLKKKELSYLLGKAKESGLTILPLKLYTKGPHIKLEIALGRGRKHADKREHIKKREVARDMRRAMHTKRG